MKLLMRSFLMVAVMLLGQHSFSNECSNLFFVQTFNPMLHAQYSARINNKETILTYGGERSQKQIQTGLHKIEIQRVFVGARAHYEVKISMLLGNVVIKSVMFDKPNKIPTVIWMKGENLLIGLSDGTLVSYQIKFNKVEPLAILPIPKVQDHEGLSPDKQIVLFVETKNERFPVVAIHYNGNLTYINLN